MPNPLKPPSRGVWAEIWEALVQQLFWSVAFGCCLFAGSCAQEDSKTKSSTSSDEDPLCAGAYAELPPPQNADLTDPARGPSVGNMLLVLKTADGAPYRFTGRKNAVIFYFSSQTAVTTGRIPENYSVPIGNLPAGTYSGTVSVLGSFCPSGTQPMAGKSESFSFTIPLSGGDIQVPITVAPNGYPQPKP